MMATKLAAESGVLASPADPVEGLAAKRARVDELYAWAQSLADEADAIEERSREVRRNIAELAWVLERRGSMVTLHGPKEFYAEIGRRWKALCADVDELTLRMDG